MARVDRTIAVADRPAARRASAASGASAPSGPRARTPLALALAALLAGAALGGCSTDDGIIDDGGIGGTGTGLGDASDTESPDNAVASPVAPVDGGPEVRPFENSDPTLGGITAGVRGVNASSRAVRILVDGEERRDGSLPPGEAGGLLRLGGSTVRALAVVDAEDGTPLARFAATLAAGSLTTLVVFDDAAGGVRVEPLGTPATGDDVGVALVRVVHVVDPAEAGARIDAVSLVPAGDAPGGAEVDFAPGAEGSIASEYVAVAAGDYRLAVDGVLDGAPDPAVLSFEGGAAHTLTFFAAPDGTERVLRVTDGDGS